MKMIKIYGTRGSGAANKVEYTAILLGLEYEYKAIDIAKDSKTEWYMKLHPAGKVPVIDDNGFVLFESSAICRYMCDKKGSTLYPKDLQQRALIDQWIDFSAMHVGDAMGKVAYNKIFAPMRGLPVDEKGLQDGLLGLDRFLPIIDNQLGKHKFLAGDVLTIADLALLSSIGYGDKANYDFSKFKNLAAWKKKIQEMDFYKKVNNS
jgi:glutathione S-transferase